MCKYYFACIIFLPLLLCAICNNLKTLALVITLGIYVYLLIINLLIFLSDTKTLIIYKKKKNHYNKIKIVFYLFKIKYTKFNIKV